MKNHLGNIWIASTVPVVPVPATIVVPGMIGEGIYIYGVLPVISQAAVWSSSVTVPVSIVITVVTIVTIVTIVVARIVVIVVKIAIVIAIVSIGIFCSIGGVVSKGAVWSLSIAARVPRTP